MARTILEIQTFGKNVDEILNITGSILMRYGYQNKIVDGENVWAKGDGVIMKMSCFGFSFTDRSVIVQGWLKDAVTGESDLEGFVAMIVKKKMKRIIEEIRQAIQYH